MKNRKIPLLFLCGLLVVGSVTGCGSAATQTETSVESQPIEGETMASQTSTPVSTTEGIDTDITGEYSDNALDSSWDESSATSISFSGSSIIVEGTGAEVQENVVTISQKGTYVVSGTLADGQLVVDLTEDENVHLVLNGMELTSTQGSPIIVMSAKNTYLTLAENTENTIHDNSEYVSTEAEDEDNINAAIYSKDDLIINGTGTLIVDAGRNDGITGKDDLQIIEGNIVVTATDDGIVGKDSVEIRDGNITVTSGGDAIKASQTDALDKGYVVIDGGNLTLSAGDDGIHSETALVINHGTINITDSLEGLESLNIVVNDGTINVKAADDGFNVAGGVDSTSTDAANGGGFAGRGGMDQAIDGALIIRGGTVTVDADGDGLDSNGGILIEGGETYVFGPTNGGNGALDYAGSLEVTGGILFASGNSSMAQGISADSEQTGVMATFDSMVSGGNEVTLQTADGTVILSVTPTKEFNSVVVSTPEIVADEVYTMNAGGNSVEVTGGVSQGTGGMGHGGGMNGRGGMRGDGEMPGDGEIPADGAKPGDGEIPADGEMPRGGKMRGDGEMLSGNEVPGDGEIPTDREPRRDNTL